MLWKQDSEEAKRRMEAWWRREVIDRVCIQVTAPRSEPWDVERIPVPPRPPTWEEYWTDLDYRIATTAESIRATYHGGEALPVLCPDLGPDLFACFFGAEPSFVGPNTAWVDPIIEDRASAPEFKIDESNRWWKLQLEFMRRAKDASQGRWITCMPDTHQGADCLVALRGRDRLALDFYDEPAWVKKAMEQLLEACLYSYDLYYGLLEPEREGGSLGWARVWGSGRTNVIQCDYLALVSPRISEEFIMPSLAAEARALDHAICHLDGPEALPHLDLLLEIPDIQAIQWVPGDGHRSMLQWIPLVRRIQAAGKSVQLFAWPHEIRTLLEELRPEGLLINTYCSSELEAKDLVEQVSSWCCP